MALKFYSAVEIITRVKFFKGVNACRLPTIRLLNSSTAVAVSGAFRLYIAFLLAGIEPRVPVFLAEALIVYSTYTLDRALGCDEDAINRSELAGASRKIGVTASALAFGAGTVIFALHGIWAAALLPFIIGYLYSKGISIGNHSLKLKGGLGRKNIVIGLTWGGNITLVLSAWTGSLATLGTIFLFYFFKLFINSAIYDIKDLEGDLAAGIRTLPAFFGEGKTRKILFSLCILLHAIMWVSMSVGGIRQECIIVGYSFSAGTIFLALYRKSFEQSDSLLKRRFREMAIDGESALAVLFRTVAAGPLIPVT
jgi:4-hydroxybenzoate polyprenyltransferase